MKDQHTINYSDAATRNTCTIVGAWLPPLEVVTSAGHRTDANSSSVPMIVGTAQVHVEVAGAAAADDLDSDS